MFQVCDDLPTEGCHTAMPGSIRFGAAAQLGQDV